MSNTRIILADGTTYEDSNCGLSGGFLWCYIKDLTVADAAQVFFNTEVTNEIRYEYGGMSDTYTGYIEVYALLKQDTGCDVCLTQPKGA